MPVIKGIDVRVHADGYPLEEREDTSIEVEDVSKAMRYIPAESGQLFEIHMPTPAADQFEGDILAYDIYADGRLLDTVLAQKGSWLAEEDSKGLLLPDGRIRHFRFSDVAIGKEKSARATRNSSLTDVTEEHDPSSTAKKDPKAHKDVGKIVVKVHHKNQGETSTIYSDPRAWTGIDVVDEKTLKGQAVSHSVGLAPAIDAEGSSIYCQSSFVDPEGVPFAEFTFLYRSAGAYNSAAHVRIRS